MTKIADVEADLAQFKITTENRLDRLEATIESNIAATHAAAAEKRHTELLAMMAPPSQPAITSPLPPPTTFPTSTIPTPSQPHSLSLFPYYPHTIPLPMAASFTDQTPPPTAAPFTTTIHSSLLFDEFGFPIPTTALPSSFHKVHSSMSDTFPSHTETTGTLFEYPYIGQHTTPPFGTGLMGERVWTPGADYRLRKLKMPLFDGTDAYGWVYRIERFFDMQGLVTTGERLRAAVLCMEG